MKRGAMDYVSKIVIAKIGLISIATAVYLGYNYHQGLQRLEESLIKGNVQVEEGYFADPIGLEVQTHINESGKKEVYLTHYPSGKMIPIQEDMLPNTEVMINSLVKRADSFSADEKYSIIQGIGKLESKLRGGE